MLIVTTITTIIIIIIIIIIMIISYNNNNNNNNNNCTTNDDLYFLMQIVENQIFRLCPMLVIAYETTSYFVKSKANLYMFVQVLRWNMDEWSLKLLENSVAPPRLSKLLSPPVGSKCRWRCTTTSMTLSLPTKPGWPGSRMYRRESSQRVFAFPVPAVPAALPVSVQWGYHMWHIPEAPAADSMVLSMFPCGRLGQSASLCLSPEWWVNKILICVCT